MASEPGTTLPDSVPGDAPDQTRGVSGLRPRHAVYATAVGILLVVASSAVGLRVLGDTPTHELLQFVIVQLALALAAAATLLRARTGWQAVRPRGIGPRALIASALLGLGALLFSGTTSARLYDLSEGGYADQFATQLLRLVEGVGFLPVLVVIGVLGPLCEELLFRGVVLHALIGRVRPWAAIGGSAALFAAYHVHPVHMLVAFTLGVLAGIAVVRTGSLWAGVVVHVANNSVAMFADPNLSYEDVSRWWIVPAMLLIGAGLAALPTPPRPRTTEGTMPSPATAPRDIDRG